MKIRILSDLHIDYSDFKLIPYTEDILVLAGDISDNPEDTFCLIEKYIKESNNKVIFILGNHDYFNDTIIERVKYWKRVGKKLSSNFYFLNQSSIVIDNIEFYGATLWSDINIDNNLNNRFSTYKDFKYIYKDDIFTCITPYDYRQMFIENKTNLLTFLNKPSNFNRVIVTHHLPSYKSIKKEYQHSIVNDMFASDLDDIIMNSNIKLWIHGHTHASVDYTIKNTRILCNPKGIDDENSSFSNDLIVEV